MIAMEDTANKLLEALPLSTIDAARLVLETTEMLAPRTAGLDRPELMKLLRHIISLGVEEMGKEENTVSFEEAGWSSIEQRAGRRPTTRRDLRHFMRRFLRKEGVGQRPLRAMTTSECKKLLQETCGSSLCVLRKGRMILHSIFEHGIRQEWCDTNPVTRIQPPAVEERTITPLTLDEVKRLEETAQKPQHRAMRFSLKLMLYCGVRPTEVSRMVPERDIDWKQRELIIRPQTSKTGGGRVIPMRKAARIAEQDRVIPGNWRRRWQRLRQDAGFTDWQADACRHTFASYHARHFHNLPALQLEMGHTGPSLLQSRYVTGFLYNNADVFWK